MNYKVLFADDEDIFLDFMECVIDWQSHDCTIVGSASSGEEAIEKIVELKPDIVFCDINMACISGLDVCAYVKNHDLNTKMIITTAHDSFSFAREAIKLAVSEYLLKPFSENELLSALNSCKAQVEQSNENEISSSKVQFLSIIHSNQDIAIDKSKFNGKNFTVSLLRLNPNESFEKQTLNDLLAKHFGKLKVKNYILGTEKEYVIVLQIHDKTVNSEVIKKSYVALMEDFNAVMFFKIAIGSIQEDVSLLRTSYENAIFAYENSIRFHDEVITYEQVLNVNEKRAFYSKDDIDLLITSFEEENEILTNDLIRDIFGLSVNHLFSFQYVVSAYHMTCVNILHHFNLPQKKATNYLKRQNFILKELDKCISTEQVFELVKRELSNIFEDCNTVGTTDKKAKIVFCVDKYLQENFDRKDLSVDIIAEALFYENSYIRRIYKEKTGKTISQALEKIRIDHAKKLLCLNYLQNEIATMCGFSDQYYFSKRFKQVCGCSPTTYKLKTQ